MSNTECQKIKKLPPSDEQINPCLEQGGLTRLVSAYRTVFFPPSSCELPADRRRLFITQLSTKGWFSQGKPGENSVLSRVRNFWDAVSAEHGDGAGRLCQAEMCELLDNSGIVEQGAGIVVCALCVHTLSLPLPLMPPPVR